MRVAAFLWLVFWLVVYWHSWGPLNFLHFCDISEILACVGFMVDGPLLVSSQAVASLFVDAAWTLDAGCAFFLRRHLIGGTEYLFDPSHALWVRLLSLFHIALPVLLLWALHRCGYDRRGLPLQLAIALPGFIASRFAPASQNLNYAYADPFFHRQWGPAPLHIVVIFHFMLFAVYLPTHLILKRVFPPPLSGAPRNI